MSGDDFIPYVAVVGGLWCLEDATGADTRRTAEILGAALADRGFGLVVYFSDERSLEPHVVRGYVRKAGDGRKLIHVRYPRRQQGKIHFAEETDRPDLFDHQVVPGDDWEGPFYRSLSEEKVEGEPAHGVDGLVLMAGGRSTLIAGHMGLARRLPILAVDACGGSAATIWSELSYRAGRDRIATWRDEKADEIVADFRERCRTRAEDREEEARLRARYESVTSGRNRSLWAGGTFLVLLLLLMAGVTLVAQPAIFLALMVAAVVAAGAAGAAGRAAFWSEQDADPASSTVLGAIAGFVVGIAYLVPQWIGGADLLALDGDVRAESRIQLFAVVLVALSAGMGFDAVFRRLRERADEVSVRPPDRS